MNISCFIVDDDPISINTLKKYIEQTPHISLEGTDTNPLSALNRLQNEETVNAVFLDIKMKEIDGLEFAERLENKSLIIFTTAYPGYAAKAFDMNVADYLVKPISFTRFLQAIERLQEKLQARQNDKPEDDFFYFFDQAQKKLIRLRYKDVDYYEAAHNYTEIVSGENHYSVYMQFRDVEDQQPAMFIRVHRSFIINSDKIVSVEGNVITLENQAKIAIGSNYRDAFFENLNQKLLRKKT
jgi:two-component system, LytTR family, response regulator